jgi:hypothetical protein
LLLSFSSIPAGDRKKGFAISDHLLIISALAVLHPSSCCHRLRTSRKLEIINESSEDFQERRGEEFLVAS